MIKEFEKRILSSILLIPLSFFFILKGSLFFNFFLLICLFVTFYEWHMMAKKKNYYLLGYFLLTISFYSAYLIRNDDLFYFLFILLVCISTDIGGYIIGKIFRGPKLNKISPNKTYSGVVGGYLLSVLIISLFIKYSKILNLNNLEFDIKLFIQLILISTVSQFGDMLISYFKRLSKIKDTGKIIPGHGGILDRIDGMIFAFPFTYLIINFDRF